MRRARRKGTVYLVGAGPGDPSLITVRGHNLLRRAHVVVVDALAPPELLRLAPATAERVRIGGGGRRRLDQNAINRLLISRARRGLRVVRLKGGDPNIFGRVGEEAEALVRARIPFEIIPGVTAALGAAATTGIPLTHRLHASSVAFATAHVRAGKSPGTIDWKGLARADTVALYMGVRRLRSALRRIMAAGRSAATPAALVRWATRPEQQVIRGTLGTIAGKAERSGLVPPAILIAGEVAQLGTRLDWFARRPLAGLSIAVTRPRDQAAALTERLCEEGARVIVAPSITLQPPRSRAPLDRALRRLGRYRYLVLTSANGVERFFDRMKTLGIDLRALAGVGIVTIGPATADAVRARGLLVAAVPEEYRAEGLLRVMGKRRVNGARVLIARAEKARAILPDVLRRRGALVEVVPVYRAIASREGWPELLRAIREDDLDLLTFTSSATVSLFMAKLRGADRRKARRIPAAVIGPITARTARENGLRVTAMPREYTVEALATTIVRRLRNSPSGTLRGS